MEWGTILRFVGILILYWVGLSIYHMIHHQPTVAQLVREPVIPVPDHHRPMPPLEKARAAVKKAMEKAWSNYSKNAFGADTYLPSYTNNWGATSLTLIDSLDTLYIMKMYDQFDEAVAFIEDHVKFERSTHFVSTFELTIRVLGGLLSAYEMSGERILLEKADEMGSKMLPILNWQCGMPSKFVRLKDGQTITGSDFTPLAEIGSLSLEFITLYRFTKKDAYKTAVDNIYQSLAKQPKPWKGLYQTLFSLSTCAFSGGMYSVGAGADSFYEYLLKLNLLTQDQYPQLQTMYNRFRREGLPALLRHSKKSGRYYLTEYYRTSNIHYLTMDHLSCFVPAMLALDGGDLWMAEELTTTCYTMYNSTITGLAAEVSMMEHEQIKAWQTHFILRPETVESLFVMYRQTGNETYRQWGWNIFSAMEEHLQVEGGYSSLTDVNEVGSRRDLTESFFFSETLKYLYLLFSPTDYYSLDEYVFTTEAHPLRKWKT